MKATLSTGITSPQGFRATGGSCGIKASGAPDLTLIVADVPCAAAAVFTRNKMTSAPVNVGQRHLKASGGVARAIVCNSGNANASTGKAGEADALRACKLLAQSIGCPPQQVLPASTGVIGRPLPMKKVAAGIADLFPRLSRSLTADCAAARGIMTTDLVPKSAARSVRLGGHLVRLAGVCKGSGMIAPNMATMLAFITTDAAVTSTLLQRALRLAAAASFNRISIDQHTSPSDTCLILASGRAGNRAITTPGRDFGLFSVALTDLCQDLAYQIVKDGEGATKVFRVRVTGAASIADADRIGRTIVDSPLVKTAVHGGDPNWGRITTAAGYSGARIVPDRMSLFIGNRREICVFHKGQPTDVGKRPTNALKALMARKEIVFTVDLGLGSATVEWLGCDLSRQYIAINADYTT